MAKGLLKWSAILGGTLTLLYCGCNVMLTGSPIPLSHIETLHSPVRVTTWVESGLVLADGRVIAVPGHPKLPNESKALSEAMSRGVEVGKDGSLTGLVRFFHGCGNDPVRFDLRRINIGHLLSFFEMRALDEHASLNKEGFYEPGPFTKTGAFGDSGWYSAEGGMFFHYERWVAKGRKGNWWD